MKYSVLDFSTTEITSSAKKSLQSRIKLAQLSESLKYHRFWISENNSNPFIVGSTPELIMSHLALATSDIRIGSAGIMVPYYNGEKIADTFKTMDVVRNNRIDVGVGQAAGNDEWFSKALNEEAGAFEQFSNEMFEMKRMLNKVKNSQSSNAYTTLMKNGRPEIFILNSSDRNAGVTADIGAGFFATTYLDSAKELQQAIINYRDQFAADGLMEKPHVILGVFISIGEKAEEIEQLNKSFDQWSHRSDHETGVDNGAKKAIIGNAEEVVEIVSQMGEDYLADELMLIPNIDNSENRERTIRLFAEKLIQKRKAFFKKV